MACFAELRRRSSSHEADGPCDGYDVKWVGKSAQSCVVMFALFDDLGVKRTGR
jgi:hypothetical protein